MLLKYLDLQGFKSFPDKTRVSFGRGLTAVVGPNGSGKSNISDAVRWVLGEQSTKTLRGEKMEDVIFTGTKSRKPQGFAEVTLTFDNADREFQIDMDEVSITRRYDRSGISEYMINRSPVRLKDIQELLMDTGLGKDGYSLIGQGKIAEIIQSKSGERREIFDEAAGISKFRYHKAESERNLARAEENLVRLRDILSELEGRIEPLKEQSQKAQRFLELSETKKKLEVSLWVDTIEKSNQLLKDQSDKLMVISQKHTAAEERIQEIENQVQDTFAQMQQRLVETETLRREKNRLESEISDMISRIAVFENDILHHEGDIARLTAELEGHAENANFTLEEIAARENELSSAGEQLAGLQEDIRAKQEELSRLIGESEGKNRQELELSEQLNELLITESKARMAISSAKANRDELSETLQKNEEMMARTKDDFAKCQKELAESKNFLEELSEREERLRNSCNGHRLKYDARQQKLSEFKSRCDKTDLKIKEIQQRVHLLEGMEQAMEGFAFSVREVMKRSRSGVLAGVRGTVSQLIEVKDEYSTAVETAIGGALQNIVVENEASAKAAIRLLKQENLGRATFLPLTSVKGSVLQENGLEQYAGFIDIAVNLVGFDVQYQNIMNSLLGRIAVVDDIDTAVLIARKYGYKFKIVTLDGQVVNAGGSLTGGSKNKSQGFLSRKSEISALREQEISLKEDLSRQNAGFAELQTEVARIEAEYTAVQAEITTVSEDRIRAEGEQKRISQLVSQNEVLLSSMEQELSEKKQRKQALEEGIRRSENELAEAVSRREYLSEELRSLQESNRISAEEKTSLADEVNSLRMEELTRQKDMEVIRAAIASLRERQSAAGDLAQKLEEERKSFHDKVTAIHTDIEVAQNAIAEKERASFEMDEKVQKALDERQKMEGETTLLHRQSKEAQEEKERLGVELSRLDEKKIQIQNEYNELLQKLWDEYELTRSEAQGLANPLEDPQKAALELAGLKNRIRALGTVNVAAIEEYKEVSVRYEYLSGQMRDAEQSKTELQRLIGELTQKMQTIFSENFEKINTQFQKIFVELFGGGKGELRLSDPGDLLETGIDILVEPPGKIINNLASLSGGEQALVAISIYFAILKVHPAPFCILDEIEAALDDVNVDKFAAYLKNMCARIQFIAITHRRGTMEASDILYGVTMQDEGVSKLLQLKVSEIEEKLNMTSTK